MTTLKGTEKQVSWAQDIRDRYIEKVNRYKGYSDRKASGEKLSIEEGNKMTALESVLFYDSLKEKEFELKTLHGVQLGSKLDLSKEEKKSRRKLVKAELEAWKNQVIEHALENDDATYWIENMRYI